MVLAGKRCRSGSAAAGPIEMISSGVRLLVALVFVAGAPRATIALTLAAKAYAFLRGRGYVTPQDVKSIGMDVLRHRVTVTYEAEAEEKSSETIITKIFNELPVP